MREKQSLLKAALQKVVINVLLPIQPKFQITEGNSLSLKYLSEYLNE